MIPFIKTVLASILVTSAATSMTIGHEAVFVPDQEAELNHWIDGLISKESEGKEHVKILDSNNKYSYGCLQFQLDTFREFSQRYKLFPDVEMGEYENLIYDCNLQKKLAKEMIKENHDNWRHWYTSVKVKGLGEPPI